MTARYPLVLNGTSIQELQSGDTIAGVSVDLTSQVTGILPVANGGTNNAYFTVSGPASSAKTYTFPNSNMSVGYLNIPAVGTKTSSYTLATSDVGKYVQVGTSGSIVIPDATFAEGDVVMLFNNTSGNDFTCDIVPTHNQLSGSITASGTTVTGTGTLFSTELKAGDYITVDKLNYYRVSSVTNNNQIELSFSLTTTGSVVYVVTSNAYNTDRKSTRLNSSHIPLSRMPSSA